MTKIEETKNQNQTGSCPATGRSASVCADSTHTACYAAAAESAALDHKLERELRSVDGSF